jgi:hypothetical protein
LKAKRQHAKWKFAIGTTSLWVPDHRWHYLIIDVDHQNVKETLTYLLDVLFITELAVYPTPHGWHIYTDRKLTWSGLYATLQHVPGVDQQWLAIGRKRGYLFLADYKPVVLPWPVVRMVLHVKKKTHPR